ncbi:DUF4041 domain-containing protein [Pendulispora albinea]|uniref:DUF4041 domain-containing protein n=1 Tax=Pendulispora albinea TaxID=2741071 RepID=A0ABZ2M381_9BACT
MTIVWVSLFVLALLVIAVLAWVLHRTNRELRTAEARAAHEAWQKNGLAHRVQELSKYQAIIDVDVYVAQARTTVAGMTKEAEASALAMTQQAHLESNRIISEANGKAHEIAGEAMAAVQKAKGLEQTVRAMQNVIDGYGERYVLPSSGLLDELAGQYGFAEAGKKLKEARERTKAMVKRGQAAECDYVETNRRATAVAFVLDAFNGKVDSVLADVGDGDFGTLRQKILDAYTLVNHHGTAFRNARIAGGYLEARLEELKWAVAVVELKAREREEQRAIREKMREEEKAQRDYERALKDAQKEEDVLRKAMEKARLEVAKAGVEQKALYEQRLRELSEKLRTAEEKNQRALSMAQQTKSGHVYIISNEGSFGQHVFKIGMTRRLEPMDRVRELGDASVPFEFDVHAMIRSDDAPALENALHRVFVQYQVNKVNARKEFFRVALADVRREIERLGIHCTWTMTAACREFRETQALERSLASDPGRAHAWISQNIREHARSMAEAPLVEAEA